jgi:hypothetical protein
MHDFRQPPSIEIERLRRRCDQLETMVKQLASAREATINAVQAIRWAETIESEGEPWPTESANVFPIRFVDPHFTAEQGLQDFEREPRSEERQAFALSWVDWLPKNEPFMVFEQRGLGPDEAGIWWFINPPLTHIGVYEAELTQGGTANFLVKRAGVSQEARVQVTGVQLAGGDPIAANTEGTIRWDKTRWISHTAACGPG